MLLSSSEHVERLLLFVSGIYDIPKWSKYQAFHFQNSVCFYAVPTNVKTFFNLTLQRSHRTTIIRRGRQGTAIFCQAASSHNPQQNRVISFLTFHYENSPHIDGFSLGFVAPDVYPKWNICSVIVLLLRIILVGNEAVIS